MPSHSKERDQRERQLPFMQRVTFTLPLYGHFYDLKNDLVVT